MALSDDTTTAADVLHQLQLSRHSCRAFRPDPVDRATIARMLELAQRAPSWCNTQPWEVFVTEGDGTERLREALTAFGTTRMPEPDIAFPLGYEGEHDARRKTCAWQLYESVGVAKGDRQASMQQTFKNFELFGAPHLAIITTERDQGTYGAVDCGVFLGNLLLAAEALGIASIPQAAIAACTPVVREIIGLPENRLVLYGISFGYEDTGHPANAFRTERAAVDDVVRWISE